jgi:hypothetical protein
MTQLGRHFHLSSNQELGVSCDENGLFVGGVPLLEFRGMSGFEQWQPRTVSDLNRDLGARYGLPVEFNMKISGLTTIARALNRGDIIHAQIATLHLRIPDPPIQRNSLQTQSEIINLAWQLQFSGFLKAEWDPAKHPRWPAGSAGGIGGEFAPSGSQLDGSVRHMPIITSQLTIPVPFELPGGIPLPSEILPGPLAPPSINPRTVPKNPYPDRSDCVEEWARAERYCTELMNSKRLGKDGYRGIGKFYYQCLMGQVSEDCGGNSTGA